jgi:glycosyltransferase involved in cell wall biosynthesis
MMLSVIVPTFNESSYVDNLIGSLIQNDGVDKEIIFADGGSTDGTRRQIETGNRNIRS